jgi:hypothetical protein
MRTSLIVTDAGKGDSVDVVFEIAPPGKDFAPYLKGRAKRAR